jgi:myosin heavy subunit
MLEFMVFVHYLIQICRKFKQFFFLSNFKLRGAQILDAVRLHKNGFPESLTFGDFWRRFRILSDPDTPTKAQLEVNEVKPAVELLLQYLDLDKTAVRLGNTQVGTNFISDTRQVIC